MLQSLRGFMLLSFIGNVNAESKVVSMQAKRMPHGDSLEKRVASAVDFGNLDHLAYYVSGSLGTPGQEIWFVVNTLLSDTWVLDPELATGAASSKMGSCKYTSLLKHLCKAMFTGSVLYSRRGEVRHLQVCGGLKLHSRYRQG